MDTHGLNTHLLMDVWYIYSHYSINYSTFSFITNIQFVVFISFNLEIFIILSTTFNSLPTTGILHVNNPPHTRTHAHTHTDHSSIENGDNNQRRIQPTGGRTTKRSNSEKGPRVRTTLSSQQQQTLRTVYGTNPRPDALFKEHLVEITGLSLRVIRVWFQNQRCKNKRKTIHAAEQARQQQAMHGGAPPNVSGVYQEHMSRWSVLLRGCNIVLAM